jgi:hypothetical protein
MNIKENSFGDPTALPPGMFYKDLPMRRNVADASDERRGKSRFPLRCELRYKLVRDGALVQSGSGETMNIGSGGVWFTVESDVKVGAFVQLAISWPVLLDQACPIRLIVFGRVLRTGAGACACTIDKYEFRTRARVMPLAMPAFRRHA